MKKSLLALAGIMLTVVLATSALASSINFPDTVFKDQSFKLLPGTGAVDCDMPSGGGNVCKVSYFNPGQAGYFYEDPANPDPDAGNRWFTFTQLGYYNVSIFECYGGASNCSSTPAASEAVIVVDEESVGAVDLQYYYSVYDDHLYLQGYAPDGAASTRILLVDLNTHVAYSRCTGVTQYADQTTGLPEFSTNIDMSSYPYHSYSVLSQFYEGAACSGPLVLPTAYAGDFNWLAISALQNDVVRLDDALNTTNATLQAQIDDLYNITEEEAQNISDLWDEVDALWDVVDEMNHGTINLYHYYDGGSNLLNVWGEAPVGASQAAVAIYGIDQVPFFDTPLYIDVTNVTTISTNQNSYYFDGLVSGQPIDLTGLPPIKMNVMVWFDNDIDYIVGALFDDLYLFWLEEWLANNTVWLEELNGTVGNHTQQIIDLQNNITTIQGEIDDLYENLTGVWQNISDLEDAVDVQWYYNARNDNLRVKGYAPEGATYARIMWRDSDNNAPEEDRCVPVNQGNSPEFNLESDPYHPQGDGWADDSYSLRAKFYNNSNCTGPALHPTAFGGDFDWLQIQDMLDRLDAIEDQIDQLWDAISDLEDMALVSIDYYSAQYGGPSIDIQGYAPSGSQSVDVWFYGSYSGEEYDVCIPVDETESPEFIYSDLDVSGWEIDSYAVEAYFYDGPACSGSELDPMAVTAFDDLLDDWLHENSLGFSLMDTQTFEAWNPQSSFTRQISWSFTAPASDWYWFELDQKSSDNGEDISKTFAGGSWFWLNSHETKHFINRNVRFPPIEGSYRVKLQAHGVMSGE
ncbi:hypothetical protein D6833_02985, partial [Candidatus Parcubacteria bacterium]